eukprot:4020956-Pyramimonas_sp.AAC.1
MKSGCPSKLLLIGTSPNEWGVGRADTSSSEAPATRGIATNSHAYFNYWSLYGATFCIPLSCSKLNRLSILNCEVVPTPRQFWVGSGTGSECGDAP